MSTAEVARDDGGGKDLTILEHLQELRRRLMVCALATVLAAIGAAFVATPAMRWLKEPASSRVENFELVFTQPLEYWTTFFRVMLLIAVTFAMPVFVWQALAYVGPGLTKNEKRWAYSVTLGASALFVAGCAFAYYVELPPALGFLLDAPDDIARPFISVKSYVDFATRLMFVTGLVFEMPILVAGLAKIGLVNWRTLLHWWRFAVIGAFVVSAVVTPSIDPITQTLVAGPMIVLYFVGIILARFVGKNPDHPTQLAMLGRLLFPKNPLLVLVPVWLLVIAFLQTTDLLILVVVNFGVVGMPYLLAYLLVWRQRLKPPPEDEKGPSN